MNELKLLWLQSDNGLERIYIFIPLCTKIVFHVSLTCLLKTDLSNFKDCIYISTCNHTYIKLQLFGLGK